MKRDMMTSSRISSEFRMRIGQGYPRQLSVMREEEPVGVSSTSMKVAGGEGPRTWNAMIGEPNDAAISFVCAGNRHAGPACVTVPVPSAPRCRQDGSILGRASASARRLEGARPLGSAPPNKSLAFLDWQQIKGLRNGSSCVARQSAPQRIGCSTMHVSTEKVTGGPRDS